MKMEREGQTLEFVPHPVQLEVAVKDGKGAPIEGADVAVAQVSHMNQASWNSPDWAYQASYTQALASSLKIGSDPMAIKTDERGLAKIPNLPEGLYVRVQVTKPGVSTEFGVADHVGIAAGPTAVVLVKAGTLCGRVLQNGRPVPNIAVEASSVTRSTGNMNEARVARGVTDKDGKYALGNVKPGTVQISIVPDDKHPGYVSKPYSGIVLKEGMELDGLDLVLEKALIIHGTVTTIETDKPVAHAKMQISPSDGASTEVETDNQGRYTAAVPSGGQYVAVREIRGHPVSKSIYAHADLDADHNLPIDLHVPVVLTYEPIAHLSGVVTDKTGNPAPNVTVMNYRQRTTATTDSKGAFRFDSVTNPGDVIIAVKGDEMSKEGVVAGDKALIKLSLDSKSASIRGLVVDDDGKPLPGVSISLSGEATEGWYNLPGVQTDANGAFEYKQIYPGIARYSLWAMRDGYGAMSIQPIRVGESEQKQLDKLTMHLADGTIDGQVLDADGKPAVGAQVFAQTRESASQTTDDKGRFHLTNVYRGEHIVVAIRDNGSQAVAKASTGQKDLVIKLPAPYAATPGVVDVNHAGAKAPTVKVSEWLNGIGYTPEQLKGKIVVIDFWATWCGPCVRSLPDVQALYAKYKEKGVIVIGIHMPSPDKAKALAILKGKGVTYPNGVDMAEKSGIGITALAFGPSGIPHLFLLDASGKIQVDTHDIEDIEAGLVKLLAK